MELSEIRDKIDAVDDQLLQLFLERMDLADEVAAYKNEHHLPILNKERERAVLARVTEKAGPRERYAYHLFSTLFELARSRQAELIDAPTKVGAQVRACLENRDQLFPQTGLVACQGVEGANSQAACDRLFPRGNILYVKTFDAVVSAVEAGFCKFGVLPIENSSNGSVRAVYELLQEHSLTIVRSTRLCIRHELLALPGVKLEDVREIYSHEQAIGQCRRVELARAMIGSPPILVLDEITANLDDDCIWDTLHLLNDINQKGTTVIMATHDSQYVNILRRRVITMSDGRVLDDVQKGKYGDVLERERKAALLPKFRTDLI